MSSKLTGTAVFVAVLFAGIPTICAQSPAPPSLQEQLEAQYQLSKMANSNACALTVTGTALKIQKPGVFAVPAASIVLCPVKYEDGKVGGPNPFCKATVKQTATTFRAGHRAYVVKIDANPQKEKISFTVVTCSDEGASWKGEVVFQFAKDYLEKASVTEVEDKISELLALDDNSDQAQASNPTPGPPQGQQPPDNQTAQPPTIQIGQPVGEVESLLGPPEKKVNLGPKQIYVYKDLKITFIDGKVSDVQ